MAGEGVMFSSEAPSRIGLIPADLCKDPLGGERSCVLVGRNG